MIKEAWKVISADSRAAFAADFQKALRRRIPANDIEQLKIDLICMKDLFYETNCVESRWKIIPKETAANFLSMAWSKCESSTTEWILCQVFRGTRQSGLNCLYRCLGVTQDIVSELDEEVLKINGLTERQWKANQSLEQEDAMSFDNRLLLFASVADAGISCWRKGAGDIAERLISEAIKTVPVYQIIAPQTDNTHAVISTEILIPPVTSNLLDVCPATEKLNRSNVNDQDSKVPQARKRVYKQTLIDNLLIAECIIRFKRGTLAEAYKELFLLVDEVAKLDPLRIQTSFHFGYIDALAVRPTSERMAGDNKARRSWYLAGYFLGFMRARDARDVVRWFSSLSPSDRDDIVFGGEGCAVHLIAKELLDCIAKAEDWEIFGRTANKLSPILNWIASAHLQEISERLAVRNYEAAQILVKHLDADFVSNLNTQPALANLAVRFQLMLGEIERGQGRFSQASLHYLRAIEINSDLDEDILKSIPIGLLLCELAVSNIEDMIITEQRQHQWETVLCKRITDIETAAASSDTTHEFKFLMAMHDLLGCTPKTFEVSEIGNVILEVIEESGMSEDLSSQKIEAAERFQAYAALADLQGAVEVKADAAARVFAAWLKDVRKEHLPPIELAQQALVAAILYGPDSAHELAQAFIHRYGAKAVREFPISDVCEKSIPVAQLVLDQITPEGRGLDTNERFGTAKQLLIAMLDSEQTDTSEIGNEVFDLMQQIVRDDPTLQRIFLQFVEESDQRLQKIMDLETRQHAVLSVAEAGTDSQFLAATAIRLMAGAQSDKAFLQDLLEIVEQCNLANTIPAHLRHCLNEAARVVQPHNAGQLDGAGLCIAFVGGDERQSQYESDIAESLTNKFPKLEFWFHYPGWTSNWNRHLSEIDNKIQAQRPSVLVLSPYVRTQFGRNIRAKMSAMNIQWRACTGRGRSSIQRAMEAAVDVAAGIGVRQ